MTEINTGAIITDCNDANAQARLELRFKSLLGVQPTFLGVSGPAADLEAAGSLIDNIHAATNLPASSSEQTGVFLINVARRGEKRRAEEDNGTPFCSFWAGKILVVSTLEGRGLQLARRAGLVDSVEVFDIPTVTSAAVRWGELTSGQAEDINDTQFRSLEFEPLVAKWLIDKRPIPSKSRQLTDEVSIDNLAWYVDSFGNVKTTLRPTDVAFEEGRVVTLTDGEIATCYRRLADVPKHRSALVHSSSGRIGDHSLDLVVQQGDAAKRHDFVVGSTILAGCAA